MSYIGQAPGLGQRSVFRFVALQGQTVFSGRDAAGLVLAYAIGTSTLVAVNGRLLSGPDYTATDGSTLTIAAPLSAGDEVIVVSDAPFSPANTYTTDAADTRFTRKRNRIVNPGMRVDQERNGASVTVPGSSYYYLIDGWALTNSTNGTFSCQRINATTPYGSPNRLRATVQTTDNSTANRYAAFNTFIEGIDIADLRFGTSGAKTVSLRVGVNFPAGNWTVTLRNAGTNGYRRWLGTIAIAPAEAGTDLYKTFTIPGDVLGTWDGGTALGLHLLINIGSGAGAGSLGWANGGDIAGAVQSDMAPAGSKFELFDVGLYEGSALPPFELPSYDDDLRKCQRYWEPFGAGLFGRIRTSSDIEVSGNAFRVPKRTAPTIVTTSTSMQVVEFNSGFKQATNYSVSFYGSTKPESTGPINIAGFSGLGATGSSLLCATVENFLAANARL